MPIHLEIRRATKLATPSLGQFKTWIYPAVALKQARLCIRLVDKPEMELLNLQYRHKNKPTNVLAFPSQLPKSLARGQLGDLVLCAEVIVEEAQIQEKSLEAHWAHLVIHGTLHLLGYDHQKPDEAAVMEALETTLITDLGYPPPYGVLND